MSDNGVNPEGAQPETARQPVPLNRETAEQLIAREKNAREQACFQAITHVLQEFSCTMEVSMLLRQNQVTPQITIVAK